MYQQQLEQDLSIMRQPISVEGFENRLFIQTGGVAPFITSAIYDPERRIVHHLWVHRGNGERSEGVRREGVQGAKSVIFFLYDQLKGHRSLEMNALDYKAVYHPSSYQDGKYIPPHTTQELDTVSVFVSPPPQAVAQSDWRMDILTVTAYDLVHGYIGDAQSYMGRNSPNFSLLFRASDSPKARYQQFFRHLYNRVPWQYLPFWMPEMWAWMVKIKMIRPLKSFGDYQGWDVQFREKDIIGFIQRELTMRRFTFGPRPPKIVPVLEPQETQELPEVTTSHKSDRVDPWAITPDRLLPLQPDQKIAA